VDSGLLLFQRYAIDAAADGRESKDPEVLKFLAHVTARPQPPDITAAAAEAYAGAKPADTPLDTYFDRL
jgi:hypothetical protein